MNQNIDRVLSSVEDDLRFWKRAMKDLVALFQEKFPPRKGVKHGWLLVLRKCAKSRNCPMCPHSVVWRKFLYRRRRNKKLLLWAFKGADTTQDRLPRNLRLSQDVRRLFEEYEALRRIIMREHRQLARIRMRVLAIKRGCGKAEKTINKSALFSLLIDYMSTDGELKEKVADSLWKLRLDTTDILARQKLVRDQQIQRLSGGET